MVSIKKNFMYQSVYQFLSMILPLVTSPILSRALGAEGVGIHTYVTTVENYFVLAANLGVYKYGTREIAKVQDNRRELSRVFWEIWVLHTLLSIAVGMVYIGYIIYIPEYKLFYSISFLSYLGSTLSLNWLFTGVEDFKKITIRDTVVKIVSFVLIVALINDQNDLGKYFWATSICNFASMLIYWAMFSKYVDRTAISIRNIFRHFQGMLILFVPILLESLYNNMDKVMLGIMCAKSEVGYYGNAQKALIAERIVYSLSIVLMPRMSNLLNNNDKSEYKRLMKISTNVILLLSFAFAFGTAAIAKEFSVIFWGEDFIASANLISVLSLAVPGILIAAEIREQYLIPAGKEKGYMLAAAIGAAVNLSVNFVMIPIYDALGAAIATLISQYVVMGVQIFVVRKELPMMSFIHGSEVYGVFGIIMYICVRLFANYFGISIITLLTEIILGALVFIVLCLIYWKLTNQEFYIDLAKKMFSSIKQKK